MKLPTLLLVGLLAIATGVSVHAALAARADAQAAKLELTTTKQLNDSTAARLASQQLQTDSLQGLLIAKDKLQGKLIAGFIMRIAARDTAVIHDTLPTTVLADSTRTAHFRDSTFAGILEGSITAPPCCTPLSLSYELHRPAFAPSVGFVQVGSRQVAVVVWQGERVEIDAPYVNIPVAAPRVGQFVEGGIAYPDGTTFARYGGYVRALGVQGFIAGEQYLAKDARFHAQVGIRKDF